MLKFSPKIKLGMLINVMLINKKKHVMPLYFWIQGIRYFYTELFMDPIRTTIYDLNKAVIFQGTFFIFYVKYDFQFCLMYENHVLRKRITEVFDCNRQETQKANNPIKMNVSNRS